MRKKIGKLMFTGLLLGGLILPASGCVNQPEPFVPPESSNKVIVNDAYDWNEDETGSNRPELGGGYVPVPPAKEAVITIAEGSVVKFKDGKNSLTLSVGEMLGVSHFDESTIGERTLSGVAVLDGEGKISEICALKDFLPTQATTIMPYFALGSGEDKIFGSSVVGDYIFDGEFNDITENVSVTGESAVVGGYLENKISVDGVLAEGSSFRCLTPMTVNEGYSYEYSYKFTNHGESEITFTAYQMYGGYRWNDEDTSVTVKKITLGAGATSEVVSVKVDNSVANTNAITVIKADAEITNLKLGVSMSVEDKTVKGPATITLKLPQGVKVEGYDGSATTFDKLVLPTKEQITNESEMGEIVGWFNVETGAIVDRNTTVLRSMTIAPYWKNSLGYEHISIGSGANSGYNTDEVPGDIVKHIKGGTGSVKLNRSAVVYGGDGYSVSGVILSDSLPVNAGAAIRFDSKRTAGVGKYEFSMSFANYGESDIHFSVYHINASSDYKSGGKWYNYETTRYRVDVQLKAGESVTKLAHYDLGANGNWLTYIVFEQDMPSLNLGIAESFKNIQLYDAETYPFGNLLDKTVTIGYDKADNGGIEVAADYLTKRVGRFIVAPAASEVTVPDGLVLEGWKLIIHGVEYDLPATRTDYTDIQVPSSDVTLKAVYSEISNTPVNISLVETTGLTLNKNYLDKEQFVGGFLVLPTDADVTNTTGKVITGWKNGDTGEVLTNATRLTEEALVLEPVFADGVTITLQLPNGMTVSGYTALQAKGGKLTLPSSEEMTATPAALGAPAGWYNVATNAFVTANTVLSENMTIAPYWTTANGYTYVQLGSGSYHGYNTDQVPGDIAKHITGNTGSFAHYGYTGGRPNDGVQLVTGGDYAMLLSRVTDTAFVQAGSAVRFDSKRTAAAGVYEFSYYVVNNGSTKLHLSIYQIGGSAEYKAEDYYTYENRYRTSVELAAGASVTAVGRYNLAAGDNWLTYIVIEEDVSALDFHIGFGYKSVAELGDAYAANPLDKTVTLAYDKTENGDIEVAASYLTKRVGRFIVAPAASEITVPENVTLAGWKLVIGTTEYDLPASIADYTSLQLPSAGGTLKAVYSKKTSDKATISLDETEGVTLSAEYLAKEQFVGSLIQLPTDEEYTNETGVPVIGWKDKATGETLTNASFIESATVVLVPVFAPTVTVTLKLPSGVTVNGYKTVQLKDAKLQMPESVTGGDGIVGWYNAANEQIVTAETTLTENITIAPYWKNAAGYTFLDIGCGSNFGYNTDKLPGDIAVYLDGGEASYKGSTLKAANKSVLVCAERTLLGSVITTNKSVSAGSAIRFDTVRSPKTAAKYEFSYTVYNKGASALHLSIYQINASGEYKTPTYYGYESRYRVDITLAAGESVTKLGQYDLGENGNFMTYVVVEEDVEALSFGIAIGYKTIEAIDAAYTNQAALENPATIAYTPADNGGVTVKDSYLKQRAGRFALAPAAADFEAPEGVVVIKWQLKIGENTYDLPTATSAYTDLLMPSHGATLVAVLQEGVTVTFQTANGVSADGAKTEYKTGEKLTLPALAQTTTDGRSHKGWYDTATGNIVTADTVVEGAMTLAPYFEGKGTALTPLSGATQNDKYGPDNISTAGTGTFSKTTDVIVGDEKGIVLGYDGTLSSGDAFRFKTLFNIQAKTYKYTLIFENKGTSTVKFTVYQVTGGTTTAGMPNQEVTLAAGESVKVELTITYTGTNGNALTYFVMGGEVENMRLGVAMAVEEVTQG